MMLKTYTAPTMAEALAEVKRDLGRDAVILHTRNVRKGGLLGLLGGKRCWEVTASPNVNVPTRVRGRYVSEDSPELAEGKSCFELSAPAAAHEAQAEDAAAATLVLGDEDQDVGLEERRSILSGQPHDPAPLSPRPLELLPGDPSIEVDEDLTRGVQQMRDLLKALGQLPPMATPAPVATAVSAPTVETRPVIEVAPAAVTPVQPPVAVEETRQETVVPDAVAVAAPAAAPAIVTPNLKPWPAELMEFHAHLLRQDVEDTIADELIHQLAMSLAGVQADAKMIADRLCDLVAARIPTAGPAQRKGPQSSKPRVIALVGPTGVGKTTTIAKLAADLKLHKRQRVGLVTMDTYRIAAVDQLRVYAEIIEVPLRTVLSAGEMHQAIYGMDADVVLIDTAGRSQNDQPRLNELRSFLAAADADEVHLVVSATASRRTALTILNRFAPLGPNRLILTKLDEAETCGTILSFPSVGGAPLAFATTGQDVPDDIEPADAWRLAQRILKGN